MTRKTNRLVVIGDAILLLVFAYGGEVSHELYFPDSLVLSVLHAALPFALVWFPRCIPSRRARRSTRITPARSSCARI